MIQTTIGIEGMACPMCEAHVKDALLKACPDIKKITVSRKTANAVIESEAALDQTQLTDAVTATGYTVTSFEAAEVAQKGFFGKLFG